MKSDEDDQHCLGNPNTSNHSGFREKLMDKLRESFDHEEYEKLWQDITEQRLKERLFNFRSGVIKSCKKFNEPGPSYLEQYPGKLNTMHKTSSFDFSIFSSTQPGFWISF